MIRALPLLMVISTFSCEILSQDDKEDDSSQDNQYAIENELSQTLGGPKTAEFPQWLIELYPDTIKEGTSPPYEEIRSIIAFTQLNDSVTYCIYDVMANGIAYHSVVATQVWKKPKQEEPIASGNDHMEYEQVKESLDYDVLDSNTILLREYTEFVPDSIIKKKGTLDDGAIYDSEDWTVNSKEYKLRILNTGMIEVVMK